MKTPPAKNSRPSASPASEAQATSTNPAFFPIGLILILTGLASSIMLSLDHVGMMPLPGCGPGSPCAAAAASPWGKIFGIPVAFIGAGHFIAMLTIWLVTKGRPTRVIYWGMLLAAAASLFYIGISVGNNLICIYCMVIHAANLLLALLMNFSSTRDTKNWFKQVAIGAVAGAMAYAILIPSHIASQKAAKERAELALRESTQKIVEQSAAKPTPTPPPTPSPTTPTPTPTPTPSPIPTEEEPQPALAKPLITPYRAGPEQAAVRIVMFTDYQCPDCYKIEQELLTLMKSTPNLSVGIKYFPLSSDCNPAMKGQNLHPNACWAARAAETAGMLKGTDGFWEMHKALFARKGSFTDAELPAMLQQMGYEPKVFEQIMQSPSTLARVKSDVDEGISLGLYFTPMIFINGVELKGWNAPNALTRAVQAVAASNPPPASQARDIPPLARDRFIADWNDQRPITVPPAAIRRTLGPADAPISVVIFGDMTEPNTADADGILRVFTAGPAPNIKYSFAHFPVNAACNPATTLKMTANGCLAAQASEAALVLGGEEAYWKIHDFIFSNNKQFSAQLLDEAALAADLTPQDLKDAMKEPFINELIAADANIAKSLSIRSVPLIYINGKMVPRWKLNNENLLAAMIMQAATK